jgi:predicted transcriptional regulator
MTPRTIHLLPDVDRRLQRVARARGIKVEELIAAAAESYLREHGELAIRIADARRAAERAHG